MKKFVCLFMSMLMMFALSACSKTIEGYGGLIEKARKEIPLSDIENMDIVIAGSIDIDERSLVWFITGNEYQKNSYFPMEFKIVKNDRFEFVKAYKAYDRGRDIAVYPWNGYVFLINNPDCEKIVLGFEDGTNREIEITGSLPFLYSTEVVPVRYSFIDEDGNELR